MAAEGKGKQQHSSTRQTDDVLGCRRQNHKSQYDKQESHSGSMAVHQISGVRPAQMTMPSTPTQQQQQGRHIPPVDPT